jgi:hypothetical protein
MVFLAIAARRRSWDLCLNHALHLRLPRVLIATIRTPAHRAQPRNRGTMAANQNLPPRDSQALASPQLHLCLMTLMLLITEWAMGITEKARIRITTLTCRIIMGRMATREYHNQTYRMYRRRRHLLKRELLQQQNQHESERRRNGKKKILMVEHLRLVTKSHLIFAVFDPSFFGSLAARRALPSVLLFFSPTDLLQ